MSFSLDTTDPNFAKAAGLRQAFGADAASRDRAGGSPLPQLSLLKESGLLKLQIPREYGGDGESWSSVLRIVREFAKVDGSLAHLFGYHFIWVNAAFIRGSPEQAERLYRATARHNWFWGNSSNTFSRTLRGHREGDHHILSGRHPFSSGTHIADYLQIAWDDAATEERRFAAVPADRPGITALDDWDGIGQRQTGSGTVTFEGVRVHKDELLDLTYNAGTPFGTIGPLLAQSVLLNVFLGSAQGALSDARDYTMSKSRPWLTSNAAKPVDDPWIRRVYGDLYIKTEAATLMADRALESLDAAWSKGRALTAEERGRAAVSVAAANAFASNIALEVTSAIFEVMGARSATTAYGFDRFWRNVRIHTLHSPVEYKTRNVGLWFLAGQFPEPNMFQ